MPHDKLDGIMNKAARMLKKAGHDVCVVLNPGGSKALKLKGFSVVEMFEEKDKVCCVRHTDFNVPEDAAKCRELLDAFLAKEKVRPVTRRFLQH